MEIGSPHTTSIFPLFSVLQYFSMASFIYYIALEYMLLQFSSYPFSNPAILILEYKNDKPAGLFMLPVLILL